MQSVRPDIELGGPAAERVGNAPNRYARRRDRFGIVLAVIALLGLVGRVAYVIWMRDHLAALDGLHYHYRALAIGDGRGFVNPLVQMLSGAPKAPPDASNPPGWPLVLAGPSALGVRSVLSHQLVSCVVGAATIVMTGVAGRAAFGRRVGLIAAGLVAVYPNVWLYERELVSEPLALLGVATCIWLAYLFFKRPGSGLAVALGATIGALAMTRSEQIALLVFLVLPLILFRRSVGWRRRITWLALAGAGCALLIAPWSLYNTTRFDRPVVLSTGLGNAMVMGNCKPTYSGDLLGYYQGGFNACNVGVSRSKDQSIADGQLRRAAVDFMRANESRVPVVVAARIGRTFNVFRPFQQVHLEGERHTSIWVLRLGLFAYWLLVPFAIYGAIVARRRKIPIYPLLAFPIIVALSVALTIGAVRYRAPAEIPLVLLAAIAVDALIKGWSRKGSPSETPPVPEARRLIETGR